jgi:hypothetical protein
MFWFALTAGCVALLDWPEERPTVQYVRSGRFSGIGRLLKAIDFGREFNWQRSGDSEFHLASSKGQYSGQQAVARTMLYHPALYLILYALAAPYEPARRWAALAALVVFVYAAVELLRARLASRTHALETVQAKPPVATAP